ncbi:Mu transposase C-terminal domain-containing protein [Tenacibaculum sp. SDUM215027]|uniref:Mu transposase C-terminal domain-containing protein n=1 Tax=Tenacibaculum sp. SDUM215027 TaxID=3422596 RepID=UPI003D319340
MDRLKIEIGEKVLFKGKDSIIIKIIDLNKVSIKILKENTIYTVDVNQLERYESTKNKEISTDILSEDEWNQAKKRYEIIMPLLGVKRNLKMVSEIAKKNKLHYSTIYRWIKIYEKTEMISSLARKRNLNGKFKGRLCKQTNSIINEKINEVYLNASKKSVKRLVREITTECNTKGVKVPHENTIRNRLKNISEEEKMRKRYGYSKARDKFHPIKGHFPGANYPLSIVQIDHTLVDIILVDEHYRNPFKRPYLTLALDVFSRMIIGFYLSFDPPGEIGTGLCISHSILPKELWMEKIGVDEKWPCWGIMKTIHLDNAKEFRGKTLRRACQNYGISIEFRPPGTPHWGGHVERVLGTISKEIHDLPGTTFSKISDRDNYNSKEKSSLTLNELEKWLTIYITKVYHQKVHSSLGTSPINKYKEGIMGNSSEPGAGLPSRLYDERRVRLDFMPAIERTIQEYGVIIDHITYYDEVLRKYIHSKDLDSSKSSKRKFVFKRDPRDISIIFFYEPELNEYFEISYRDTSQPPISIWEYRMVVKKLKENQVSINEEAIFNGYKQMEEIELKAVGRTKSLKSNTYRMLKKKVKKGKNKDENISKVENRIIPKIEPFDDIEDETFTY